MKIIEKIKIKKEREIRFLGIPVIQYGIKEGNEYIEKYFKIFPKSFEHKALDKILEFVPKEHDHIWIIRTMGLGETQLLNFMMEELTKKWRMKNPCFASNNKIFKELFELYTDKPFYHINLSIMSYAPYLKNRNIKYKGKYFHIYHNTADESLTWLKQHEAGDTSHAITAYKKWLDIKEFQPIYPHFSEAIKQSAIEKIKSINLNIDKFVFFVPEANTMEKTTKYFWTKLTQEFENKGYDVYVNTVSGNTAYGKSSQLNIQEAAYIASLAKRIISLRCGFCEILAALKHRPDLFVIYNKHGAISTDNFLKIYSFKEYPFVNTNIYEYKYTMCNFSDFLKDM